MAAESRAQVAPVGDRRHDELRVGAIQGSGLELVGPAFFPKSCRLEVALSLPGGPPIQGLRGVVSGVKMAAADPLYRLSVHIAEAEVGTLAALGGGGAAARESGRRSGDVGALGAGNVPGWASLLVGQGLLAEPELRRIAADARGRQMPLDKALAREGAASPEAIAACMALDMSVVYVDPERFELNPANRELLREDLARRHVVFPLFHTGGVITLGMQDPGDLALIDQIRLRTNCQVDPCVCPPGALEALIDRAWREEAPAAGGGGLSLSPSTGAREAVEEPKVGGRVVALVEEMLRDSARTGASDIHIEPERDHVRVRIRVDGMLHETASHPLELNASIVSRLKVMAKLDISETRRPQDGHFTASVDGKTVDVRVSTIPTVHGENAVLRLLLSDSRAIGLGDLGMPGEVLERLQGFLDQPNGMVLVTGPTGSGKTSTLYAALERLNTMDRNIVTVEDPVEKRVPLLRQTEVNPKAGITFASGLRSILRQDPDVIMVGEIRDRETAEIAVQAALTGHLVLSTLHTNTAAGAIVRLSEMGVTPFLLTSSLRAVIGQRLVRKVCAACARAVEPDARLVAGLEMEDAGLVGFMSGGGCQRCLNTGFKGRTGIYEVLEITPKLARVLLGGASREEIELEAQRSLAGSLRDDGLRKVRAGVTTLGEVARIVGLSAAATTEAEL